MRQHLAALRVLLVLSVLTGVLYPAVVTLAAQLPGLKANADGSLVSSGGRTVGSSLLGQTFKGDQWLLGRPDADDPTASGASNLGPESIVDTQAAPSLLTQVCTRSKEVGEREHVDGSRPFCTSTGVGAVLGVFWSGPGFTGHVVRSVSLDQPCPSVPFTTSYEGAPVTCASGDTATAEVVPIRGDAPSHPVVPADAVTASGSGLDPDISPAYARLQEPRIARARGMTVAEVDAIVRAHTTGRLLGFLGEARVDVLAVDRALEGRH